MQTGGRGRRGAWEDHGGPGQRVQITDSQAGSGLRIACPSSLILHLKHLLSPTHRSRRLPLSALQEIPGLEKVTFYTTGRSLLFMPFLCHPAGVTGAL